jgi:hypothetical protein
VRALYALCRRLSLSPVAALLSAAMLAAAPSFWAEATIQRVYALNALFVVLATAAAWRFCVSGDIKALAAGMFVCGLGASNHTSMAVMPPFSRSPDREAVAAASRSACGPPIVSRRPRPTLPAAPLADPPSTGKSRNACLCASSRDSPERRRLEHRSIWSSRGLTRSLERSQTPGALPRLSAAWRGSRGLVASIPWQRAASSVRSPSVVRDGGKPRRSLMDRERPIRLASYNIPRPHGALWVGGRAPRVTSSKGSRPARPGPPRGASSRDFESPPSRSNRRAILV